MGKAHNNPNLRFDLEDFGLTPVCSTGDLAPVNLQAEWSGKEYCYDLEGDCTEHGSDMTIYDFVAGNMYQKGDTLSSCCGCLVYTCIPEERDKCLFWRWKQDVSLASCCMDCDGMVFSHGSVMRSTHLNDTCDSIETERCEEYSLYAQLITFCHVS